jgi:IclR family pca regulon transcriptional regulator
MTTRFRVLRDNRTLIVFVRPTVGEKHSVAAPRALMAQGKPLAAADYVQSLDKGLQVLGAFDAQHARLSVSQAAARTAMSRAAARRHLLTLQALGYLASDGRQFWLTPKVLGFGGGYLASAPLAVAAQPELEWLGAHTGCSASLVVREGDVVVVVARSAPKDARGRRVLPYGVHLGARLPLHATSTGQVLLASDTPARRRAWLGQSQRAVHTQHTLVTASALQARVAHVHRTGYALASEEHEWGVHAVAVAVRHPMGHAVAALNLIAQTPVAQRPGWPARYVPAMQEVAQRLGALAPDEPGTERRMPHIGA